MSVFNTSIMNKAIEKRTEARELVDFPVAVRGGGVGRTRDVSANGMFLEMDAKLSKGSVIDFNIELSLNGELVLWTGQGKVVRVETRDRRTGVALKLLESKLADKQVS